MIQNIKNVIEKINGLDIQSLQMIRNFLFGVIIVDVFGIWWYLNLKSLGFAVLLVSSAALAYILIIERRKQPQMVKKKKHKKEKQEKEEPEKEEYQDQDFGFSLPSADEYNERMEKAFGKL